MFCLEQARISDHLIHDYVSAGRTRRPSPSTAPVGRIAHEISVFAASWAVQTCKPSVALVALVVLVALVAPVALVKFGRGAVKT